MPNFKPVARVLLLPLAATLALLSFAFADDAKPVESKATTETTTTESSLKVGDATKKTKHVKKKKFNPEGQKVKEEVESTSEVQR